jgi:long-chain acyl-CoA synthetase
VKKLVEGEVLRLAESFRSYEKPRAIGLLTEDFTVENGLLTPSLKLKRREAIARHGAALEALYREPLLETTRGDRERPPASQRIAQPKP